MKLSIFYHHLVCAAKEQGKSIDAIFAWAKEIGIDFIEIDMCDIEDADALGAMLQCHEIGVSCIYGFYSWQETPKEFFGFRQIELAKKLQAQRIMVIPGFYTAEEKKENGCDGSRAGRDAAGSRTMTNEEIRTFECRRMLDSMKYLCETAVKAGIEVTIEDFDDERSPIGTIKGMQHFVSVIPKLTVTLDTGNFFFGGEDVQKAQQIFEKKIAHVHLKDRKVFSKEELVPRNQGQESQMTNNCMQEMEREEDMEAVYGECKVNVNGVKMYPCSVGEGCIPIREILKKLKISGYEGNLAIEHFGAANYTETIEKSVCWVKKCLSE